jgi:hypothetical protein
VTDPVIVLIAYDRLDQVATGIFRQRVNVAAVRATVGERLVGPPALIAAQGEWGPYARFSRERLGSFARARNRQSGLEHVRNAQSYGRRFKTWLRRFRGVSTRYLGNYLAWHRALDRPERLALKNVVLRWPLGNESTTHNSYEHSARVPERSWLPPP